FSGSTWKKWISRKKPDKYSNWTWVPNSQIYTQAWPTANSDRPSHSNFWACKQAIYLFHRADHVVYTIISMAQQRDANYLAFCLALPVRSIHSFAVLIQQGLSLFLATSTLV